MTETNWEYSAYDPEATKEVVLKAQNNDAQALQTLYEWYLPLVRSIARSYTNYNIFGEDAENIAWVIFYECIKNFTKENYKHFPGYVKAALITRMNDEIQSKHYTTLSNASDDIVLMNETTTPDDYWEQHINNVDLQIALNKLKLSQQRIIKYIYFEGMDCSSIAQTINKSIFNVHYHHNQSMKRLRKIFRVTSKSKL